MLRLRRPLRFGSYANRACRKASSKVSFFERIRLFVFALNGFVDFVYFLYHADCCGYRCGLKCEFCNFKSEMKTIMVVMCFV